MDQTYTLTSPIAGTVVERNINPGQELRPDQMVANSPPLFVVTNPATLWAIFDASERDLVMLRVGKVIQVSTPAYRDERYLAKVEAIADFLDPATRTLKIRTRLDNLSRKLKAEMFVTADVASDGDRFISRASGISCSSTSARDDTSDGKSGSAMCAANKLKYCPAFRSAKAWWSRVH